MNKKDLLGKQLEDIDKARAKKPQAIDIPKSVGIKYNAELQKMISIVRSDIGKMIVPQVKSLAHEYTADGWSDVITASLTMLRDKWNSTEFNLWARKIAESFIHSTNEHNIKQFQRKGFGIDAYSASDVNEYIQASIKDNVRLIKTIPEQYLNQVDSIVLGNMRSGLRPSAIVSQLSDQFGVTKRRAKVIARDQTSKAANGLARKRMVASGIKYFKWMTSKDERVRSRHSIIANKKTKYGIGVYRWDDLPLSDKGEPIAPGDDFLCRCTAMPVLESTVLKFQRENAN